MSAHDEPLHIAGSNNIPHGQVPTDDDLYWVGAMRQVFVDSLRTMHLSALAMFAASIIGWTIVICALIYADAFDDVPSLVIGLLPLAAWSVSSVWSLRVLSIRRYRYFANSPDSARQAIMRIARRKKRQLTETIIIWCIGIVAFMAALAYHL
jgi:hypothetical protein